MLVGNPDSLSHGSSRASPDGVVGTPMPRCIGRGVAPHWHDEFHPWHLLWTVENLTVAPTGIQLVLGGFSAPSWLSGPGARKRTRQTVETLGGLVLRFPIRRLGFVAAVGGLVLTLAAACAPDKRLVGRPSTVPEADRAAEALIPLLVELDYPLTGSSPPVLQGGCKVGFIVVRTLRINAGARPGAEAPCVHFTMFVTEGALTSLPVAQLRGIMAHELGHVHLGHFRNRHDRAAAGGPATWWLFRRAFDREEELAADDFAARLLRDLEYKYPGSCDALVSVFELLSRQRGGAADWLSTHPNPGHRAKRTRAACQAG